MDIQFLGTGAGQPSKARNVSSLALKLLDEINEVWLFDCGEGTQNRILETTIRPRKVSKIFITHLHGDHIFGLPGFLSSRAFQANEEQTDLEIYGPQGIKSFGFCYESEGLGRIFSENEEEISNDLLFEIAQIFPHQLVFEESGKIYMKAIGEEEIVSVESLTPLTDLENLADGRKRLKGYSQEDLLQEARAFSGKFYYRSENRTAMLYID